MYVFELYYHVNSSVICTDWFILFIHIIIIIIIIIIIHIIPTKDHLLSKIQSFVVCLKNPF
jgi:hypothetical protein